ncbi:MAG: flagellin lysine-N-methylase [Oscillospiraceae bacterium]|nr:flagellin lysine-N-methylase [Oscillospiraceae bacterium]
MITPDYYDKFGCIGGKCRNNCCKGGWDIEVDDDALDRFGQIEGSFGERVRSAVNEENCFKHVDGHCPLLSDDGWCEMVRHGKELCIICDEYPRFTEYWEDYCERGISVSCEAAADIILNNKSKVKLAGKSEPCSEPIFTLIYKARNKVFEILQNRDIDIFKRMSLALDYTAELQEQINIDDYKTEPDFEPVDRRENHISAAAYIDFIKDLEMLNPSWGDILKRVYEHEKNAPVHTVNELMAEQLIVYFVFRYYLKGAFDCDVLSKMKLAIVSVMTIIAIENVLGDFAECARLYSIEIEHDEDNLEAIYDEFLFSDVLTYENILDMIG